MIHTILGHTLLGEKPIIKALREIYGLGNTRAKDICFALVISPNQLVRDFTENEILELHPGESIVIDKKEKHRVQNFGDETLEIIEIQTGTYFGEDDIVRFEDKYGRKDFH